MYLTILHKLFKKCDFLNSDCNVNWSKNVDDQTSFIKSLSSSLKSLWKASPLMKPSGNCWAAWRKQKTGKPNNQVTHLFTITNYSAICIDLNDSLPAVRLHMHSIHDLHKHVHRHSLLSSNRTSHVTRHITLHKEERLKCWRGLDLTHGLQTECWCALGLDSTAPRKQPRTPRRLLIIDVWTDI